MMKWTMRCAIVVLLGVCLGIAGCGQTKDKDDGTAQVLCTTFPIYQITRNVVGDDKRIEVKLLLPARLGCPHGYALTTQDMQKLSAADVLIVNGQGLEEFLDKPLERANSNIRTIDSSAGITELIAAPGTSCAHGCAGHGHSHESNPHLFVSPRMNGRLAQTIAAELGKVVPDSAKSFTDNAAAYVKRMQALSDELSALGKQLKNQKIVQPHGAFDYLARDMGLEIVASMQEHGQEPSAAEMLELVKTLKDKKPGAIFSEPQYPDRVGESLSEETGVPFAVLDPAATGPEDAPLDYYDATMRKNMETLKSVLGTK